MSDIQAGTNRVAIEAATGQTYGEAGKQRAAQRAVPMGAPPTEARQVQRPVPGTLGSLTRPTERPAGTDYCWRTISVWVLHLLVQVYHNLLVMSALEELRRRFTRHVPE
jgi:hypothetical protein